MPRSLSAQWKGRMARISAAVPSHPIGDHEQAGSGFGVTEFSAIVLIQVSDPSDIGSRDHGGTRGIIGGLLWPRVGRLVIVTQCECVPPFLRDGLPAGFPRGLRRQESSGF